MYRIVKYRGKYAISYGKPAVRKSLGTDDLGLAHERAPRLWAALNSSRSERMRDIWSAYVADRSGEVADTQRFNHAWKALGPHFGHLMGSAITKPDCISYYNNRKTLGRADSTVRTELEYLRAAINFQYGRGNNKVWLPPASKPRDYYLTRDALSTLLEHVETPHVRLFVVLAVTTGARMGALLDLEWSRVDFGKGVIDLNPAGRNQTNKRRTLVPMNSRARVELEAAFQARLSDFVIEYAGGKVNSVKKAIRSAAKRSGIKVSPHVFRHTAGVWMAQADVPMQMIAEYLGHTTTRMTERVYARYTPGYMGAAAKAVNF